MSGSTGSPAVRGPLDRTFEEYVRAMTRKTSIREQVEEYERFLVDNLLV